MSVASNVGGPAATTEENATTQPAPRKRPFAGLTRTGIAATLIALMIAGSAFKSLRISAAGLLVHPYLPAAIIVFFVFALGRLHVYPRRALSAMMFFLALYAFSAFLAGGGLGEVLKIGASAVTILAVALTVRTPTDFRMVTLGLNLAVVIISAGTLIQGAPLEGGINPMEEIANKNAFSLYALPPLLLAAHVMLDKTAPRWMRLGLVGSSLIITFAVFSTANRSGWLGVGLIGAMHLVRGKKLQTALLVGAVGIATYYFIGRSESSKKLLQYRYQQTVEGYHSDEHRKQLIRESFAIARENPLFGVGPQRLPKVLARRLRERFAAVDPHNAFGHLAGGCGFLTLFAFFYAGYTLWQRPGRKRLTDGQRNAHALLRMILVLWLVRGMFSREILYNPSFALGIGLCVAYALMQGLWARRPLQAQAPPVGRNQ